MKKAIKTLLVSLAIVILSIGFIRHQYLVRLDNQLSRELPFLYQGNLNMYKISDTYLVVIRDHHTIAKTVEFSRDRLPSNVVGLKLEKVADLQAFLGKSIEEIKQTMGEIHAETGNGFYIPSYITKDGYLIKLWIEDGVVAHASKIDLLSGEGIEWYSLGE